MASIGSFGCDKVVDDDPDTFTWHGVTFELPASVSAFPILEFAAQTRFASAALGKATRALARAETDEAATRALADKAEAEMTQMAALNEFLRETIGAAQWGEFRRLALEYGDQVDDVMRVCQAIYQTLADGRPTRRSPESSGGRSTNGSGLPDGSVSPEPSPGPTPRAATQDTPAQAPGTVRVLTEADRARAEIQRALMPVEDGIRSYA